MSERRTTVRRTVDPKPIKAHEVKLCDHDRLVMQEIMERLSGDQYGGMTEAQHTAQHAAVSEILPWLTAQRHAEEERAKFWSKLVKDNIIKGVGILLLIAALSVFFGWTRSVQWFMQH